MLPQVHRRMLGGCTGGGAFVGLVADAEDDDRMDYWPEAIDAPFGMFELRGRGAKVEYVIDRRWMHRWG